MRRSWAVKTVVSGIEMTNGKQTESDKQAADELCYYFSKKSRMIHGMVEELVT